MAESFLESYLVSLGFSPDTESFSKFKGALDTAEKTVTSTTTGMAKRIAEFQFGVIGAYSAISAAILGTIDNVAKQDQQYRLLGESLLMPAAAARKMTLITEALGASMSQILWDPELRERAQMMGSDIDRMTGHLGTGFEPGMRQVRDFNAEFSRLGIGIKFLAMQFAGDMWAKLAPRLGITNLHDAVTKLQDAIPGISDKLTTYAIPALEKTWMMAKVLGYVVEQGAVAFTNMVGALTGDHSIEGAAFSFGHLATAISHVGDWFVKLFLWIAQAELLLGHLATGVGMMFQGKWGEASAQWRTGLDQFMEGAKHSAITVKPTMDIIGGAPGSMVDKIASVIIKQEGAKPDSTNRGNLRSWEGVPTIGGFAQFEGQQQGDAALLHQIQKNIDRHLTLREFFAGQRDATGQVIPGGYHGYAPAGDGKNDPESYAWKVATALGSDIDTPLNQIVASSSDTKASIDALKSPMDQAAGTLGEIKSANDANTASIVDPLQGIDGILGALRGDNAAQSSTAANILTEIKGAGDTTNSHLGTIKTAMDVQKATSVGLANGIAALPAVIGNAIQDGFLQSVLNLIPTIGDMLSEGASATTKYMAEKTVTSLAGHLRQQSELKRFEAMSPAAQQAYIKGTLHAMGAGGATHPAATPFGPVMDAIASHLHSGAQPSAAPFVPIGPVPVPVPFALPKPGQPGAGLTLPDGTPLSQYKPMLGPPVSSPKPGQSGPGTLPDGTPVLQYTPHFGPPTSSLQPPQNWAPWLEEMNRPIAAQPQTTASISRTVHYGDVNVHVTHPGADEHQIARTVMEAIREREEADDQLILAQLTPAYA